MLYDRHGQAAYSLAYRMMGEKQAAEDLTQAVFLKVWRSAGGYRAGRGSVRTWILSIVHNRSIDQIRSLASRRRTQEKVEAEAPRSQPSEVFAEAWRSAQRDQVRGSPRQAALRATRDPRARVLLRLHPGGDSAHAWPAIGHGQGTHAPGAEKVRRLPPPAQRGGPDSPEAIRRTPRASGLEPLACSLGARRRPSQ